MAQTEKNLLAMKKTQVRSPSREDPLEKEIATHYSILVWHPMDRGTWQAAVHGVVKSQMQMSDVNVLQTRMGKTVPL